MWGVASTRMSRNQLDDAGIQQIQQGIVPGIAGYLIAEGERRGLDVTACWLSATRCTPTREPL
ncbi:MAG: hypothetical protein CM1200mP32_11480 [Methanobacteriota archaeon]|nr:MAG: hypothetical protein CM1200mP32_11480 [Euryarchaeota archaeon]